MKKVTKKVTVVEKQVIGYARISTDKQEAERQKLDIYEFAENQDLAVTKFVTETISSKKSDREIFNIMDSMNKGDILIVTELSRLARSMVELNQITSNALAKGIIIKSVVGNRTIDDSIESQVIVFAFGLASQIERDMISMRTKSALKAKKAQGITLGRPEGKGVKVDKAITENNFTEEQILDYISKGMKAEAISKLLKLDARTVREWIKIKATSN